MSVDTNLVFLVIFGVAGFIIDKFWDFNPYEYWTRFGTISLIASLIIAYIPVIFNPMDVVGNTNRIVLWFVDVLPGTIIGDIAGQIIAKITGGR